MTILKFLNTVKLSLFSLVNVIMQSFVRRGTLFTMNLHLKVTKHRAVEVEVVDVVVILGRQLRRKQVCRSYTDTEFGPEDNSRLVPIRRASYL